MSVAARDLLISLAEAVVPVREPKLRFSHFQQGLDESPETARTRTFDLLSLQGPADDGEAAITDLRWRETFGLRVAYQAGARTNLRQLRELIADDMRRITMQLFNPANWTSVVDLIEPLAPLPLVPVGDIPNAPKAWLVILPVFLIYHN